MEIAVVKWKSFVSPGWVASALLLSANPANASLFSEGGFQQLYLLNIPNIANYNQSAPVYSVDNSGAIADGSFDRVAYYLELQQAEGAMQWVWLCLTPLQLSPPISASQVTPEVGRRSIMLLPT